MSKERLIGSYLVRFSERRGVTYINLLNLRTGERLEFETWVSAWAFLEKVLEGQTSLLEKGN
ncbi:MAG: hypothetical protein KC422_11540 [Trueperaceae bacterium]|nr:hypothetical protein [Trueperaceae bacterium]